MKLWQRILQATLALTVVAFLVASCTDGFKPPKEGNPQDSGPADQPTPRSHP